MSGRANGEGGLMARKLETAERMLSDMVEENRRLVERLEGLREHARALRAERNILRLAICVEAAREGGAELLDEVVGKEVGNGV